jgi:hypothetical protein
MDITRFLAAMLRVTRMAWFGPAEVKTLRAMPIASGTITPPAGGDDARRSMWYASRSEKQHVHRNG